MFAIEWTLLVAAESVENRRDENGVETRNIKIPARSPTRSLTCSHQLRDIVQRIVHHKHKNEKPHRQTSGEQDFLLNVAMQQIKHRS